jgi:hypothetical protein
LRTSTQVPAPTLTDPFRTRRVDLPPDPVRLSACYTVASGYYAGVQAGVLLDVFEEAQDKQERYEQWVASVRNGSVGYFDNGATVFYASDSSYCGFKSPNHLQFFQTVNSAPSLGRQEPDSFGTYTGACLCQVDTLTMELPYSFQQETELFVDFQIHNHMILMDVPDLNCPVLVFWM